jgi:hypothetical protein
VGAPDVIDATGAGDIRQGYQLPRLDNQEIHIAPRAIPTRDTAGGHVANARQFPQRAAFENVHG